MGSLLNIFRVPELRRRLAFTAFILALYRVGSYLPAPGVDTRALGQFFGGGAGGNSLFGLLDVFSGGALSNLSLFALGIMPYITASIILQLMTVVIRRSRSCRRKAWPATRRSRSTPATSP